MKKRVQIPLLLVLLLACAALLLGCGSQSADGGEAYQKVISEEKITVEDALAQLKDLTFSDPEQAAFVQMLEDLQTCSGGFVQTSEDNGDRYGAEVAFYLVSGVVKCSVTYDNYMGEIADGDVKGSSAKGFLFEAEPTGTLFSREQDFHIWFGAEKLRISWAEGACDYTLDRGDGSVEGVKTAKEPFEESHAFQTILETVENSYADNEHQLVYDADTMAVTLYVEAAQNTEIGLRTKNEALIEAWEKAVETQRKFNETGYQILKVGGAREFNIIWVFRLDSGNQYTQKDYALWIQNGEVKYDYAMDVTQGSISTGGASSDSASSGSAGSGSAETGSSTGSGSSGGTGSGTGGSHSGTGGSSTHAATTGEKNALRKAADYLDFTAFSYTGLIEQLEYEGYSHSEAVYAADNCGADWYEQAALKAADYLDFMAFSRSDLISQLEYEGFTHDQAVYGAERNGY